MPEMLSNASNLQFYDTEINIIGGHNVRVSVETSISYPPSERAQALRAIFATFHRLWRIVAQVSRVLDLIFTYMFWISTLRLGRGALPQIVVPLDATDLDTLYPPSSCCQPSPQQIYPRLMICRHGLPMWNPRPSSLPSERKAGGVVPGDVVEFIDGGTAFRYLYNIWDDQESLRSIEGDRRTFCPPPERDLRDAEMAYTDMGSTVKGADEWHVEGLVGHTSCYCDVNFAWSQKQPHGASDTRGSFRCSLRIIDGRIDPKAIHPAQYQEAAQTRNGQRLNR
ncbi:hypothetical protein FA15DRAFT_119522 [Coprinopsis marcescibilis]|uniref:Uncharacterized protein n=1 Tax=Coprinopsis marcescibilis TaxID=230819 RepID=A0A5C3LH97_COPMA|nr:hypothetical protein FA15DRAFT_119522 [Coprinopsis marcescibilis]